jgi:hypothetical protein
MRHLILHIGNPSAGSTSLQEFFFENRNALLRRGVVYPSWDLGRTRAHHNLAWSLSPLPWMKRQYDPGGLTLDKLAARLRGHDADVIVLSSEHFSVLASTPSSIPVLDQFALDNDLTIDVAVFIRPQHSYLNSIYAQLTKSLNCGTHFRSFLETMIDDPHFDYAVSSSAWESGSRMRLVPVPFLRDGPDHRLVQTFVEAVGIADRLQPLLGNPPATRLNRRPGALTIETCRRASHLLAAEPGIDNLDIDRRLGLKLSAYLRKLGRRYGWDEMPFVGLDNVTRDQIRDRYSAGNESFARRHWNAAWHEIFQDDYAQEFIPNEFDTRKASPEEDRLVDKTVAMERPH